MLRIRLLLCAIVVVSAELVGPSKWFVGESLRWTIFFLQVIILRHTLRRSPHEALQLLRSWKFWMHTSYRNPRHRSERVLGMALFTLTNHTDVAERAPLVERGAVVYYEIVKVVLVTRSTFGSCQDLRLKSSGRLCIEYAPSMRADHQA